MRESNEKIQAVCFGVYVCVAQYFYFPGQSSKIVTWCRFLDDMYPSLKTSVNYDITGEFLNFKIVIKKEMDSAVDVSKFYHFP